MKKYIILFLFIFSWPIQAQTTSKNEVENFYFECNSKIPKIEESEIIKGNIKDVQHERKLRQCLKNKLFEIAEDMIFSQDIEKFKQTINELEYNYKQLYTSLFFCRRDSSEEWCKQRSQDDMSLESLQREKAITSQIVKQLYEILELRDNNQ